ncbi:MAG: hypothetical protein IT292_03685 [Deltaproteobacteria bacterium]|nr:hypothetical protein [Deltaproteobacteria bacterium]
MNKRRSHAHIFDNLHYAVDKLSDSNANNLVTIGQKPEFFCFTSGGCLVPIPLEL